MFDLNNWGKVIVSSVVVFGFIYILFLIVTIRTQGNAPSEVQLVMLGALGQAFGQVVSYWVGSSAGSAKKDEALASAAANATPPTGR